MYSTSNSQLFIIVPYRDRAEHLKMFLAHYNSILPDAKIVIVEQDNRLPFNRGWLLNCGFDFINKVHYTTRNHFAFHDVDMLYMNGNASEVYGYPSQPTHIATACSQFKYQMPYANYCGGVILLNKSDFIWCNGFSNSYQGWGAEDDDFRKRIENAGMTIKRIPNCIFQSLPHPKAVKTYLHRQNVHKLLNGTTDGLSTLTYKHTITQTPTHIHLKVK